MSVCRAPKIFRGNTRRVCASQLSRLTPSHLLLTHDGSSRGKKRPHCQIPPLPFAYRKHKRGWQDFDVISNPVAIVAGVQNWFDVCRTQATKETQAQIDDLNAQLFDETTSTTPKPPSPPPSHPLRQQRQRQQHQHQQQREPSAREWVSQWVYLRVTGTAIKYETDSSSDIAAKAALVIGLSNKSLFCT